MTANYEYSRSNRENLPLPLQMQLSEKPKTFSEFFIAFLKSTLNFEHFKNKMSLIAQVFLKLLTPKKRSSFWKPFSSECVKESQKLLKSAEKYFYLTFSSFWAKDIFSIFYCIFEIYIKFWTFCRKKKNEPHSSAFLKFLTLKNVLT